tara:strand:- start:3853 stop:4347 length:495 start_codon:yes stop_codon:yes gene_type:complete
MSYFGTAFNPMDNIVFPPLPPKPKFIKKEPLQEISEEEFQLHKKILTDIYYHNAKQQKGNSFLRQVSGPGYIVNGVKQTVDWTNMYISDCRYMNNAKNDEIADIIKTKSSFAIYHYLITDKLTEKMPEEIFKKYINYIWSTMKKYNMTLPAPSTKSPVTISSNM